MRKVPQQTRRVSKRSFALRHTFSFRETVLKVEKIIRLAVCRSERSEESTCLARFFAALKMTNPYFQCLAAYRGLPRHILKTKLLKRWRGIILAPSLCHKRRARAEIEYSISPGNGFFNENRAFEPRSAFRRAHPQSDVPPSSSCAAAPNCAPKRSRRATLEAATASRAHRFHGASKFY